MFTINEGNENGNSSPKYNINISINTPDKTPPDSPAGF